MGYTVIIDGKRPCITCGEMKPLSEFYSYPYTTKQGKRSARYDSRCVPCNQVRRMNRWGKHRDVELAKHRVYVAANRDRLNQSLRDFRAKNPDRLKLQRIASQHIRRKAAGSFNSTASREMVAFALDASRFGDKYLDAYSGELIDRPTVDHIVPLQSGGTHHYDNLCITSLANNSSKHTRPLLVWLLERAA